MKNPLLHSRIEKIELTRPFRHSVSSHVRTAVFTGLVLTGALLGLDATASPADKAGGAALLSSSVEIRDNPSNYDVRVTLPANDAPQIGVRLEGKTLRIASGQSAQGARYEQSFLLPEAADGSSLTMNRENDRLTITVPKGPARQHAAAVSPMPQSAPGRDLARMNAWSGRVLSQFARIQQQMDSMMNQAMQNFGDSDPFENLIGGGFMDALSTGRMFNLEEKPDKFVITANVSKDEAKNVKVAVENERMLKLAFRNETSGGGNGVQSIQSSDYTEVLTLPKPVDAGKMTMDYKNGGLEIVLPKA